MRLIDIKRALWHDEKKATGAKEREEIYLNNLEAMQLASAALVKRRAPDIAGVTFREGDFHVSSNNKDCTLRVPARAGKNAAKRVIPDRGRIRAGIGDTTAKRARLLPSPQYNQTS